MPGRARERLRNQISGLGVGFLDWGSDFWTEIGRLDWDLGSWTGIRGVGLTFGVLDLYRGDLISDSESWIDILGAWFDCQLFGLTVGCKCAT